ncbi:MAG: hypothetical protein JHD10_00325 [Sphingomonadaceae bacterium]|nr:hypothetical protein [Sphingomonadaceae bacterium]
MTVLPDFLAPYLAPYLATERLAVSDPATGDVIATISSASADMDEYLELKYALIGGLSA